MRSCSLLFSSSRTLIFYQSGVDPLATDVLARPSLIHYGLIERDRRVFMASRRAGVPLVLTSGGGYSPPIALSAEAHANTYHTAWQVFAAH
jgi:acetoin utilization deacetylase AcuC-like enzyme